MLHVLLEVLVKVTRWLTRPGAKKTISMLLILLEVSVKVDAKGQLLCYLLNWKY